MHKQVPIMPRSWRPSSRSAPAASDADLAMSASFPPPIAGGDSGDSAFSPRLLRRVAGHAGHNHAGEWPRPPVPRNILYPRTNVPSAHSVLSGDQSPLGPASAPTISRRECWPRLRLTTAGFHGRPPTGCACFLFFPRSVGFGPTASRASGALVSAPSMLCQDQAIPSISSYSAKPCRHNARKTPWRFHSWKYLCTELALPYSLGKAFHWHPVRRTYMIAENTCRGSIGFRPPPGLRLYLCPFFRRRDGIKGATRSHNSSEIVHDLIAPMCYIIKEVALWVNS
jgi:hypothetical protein